MDSFLNTDWANGTPDAHLEIARRADDDQLRALVRLYDWRLYPEKVLGWAMAQQSIDLGAALTCFLNGEPERFNYLAKRDVPDHHRSAALMLDNICLRVNSGFYLVCEGSQVTQEKRLRNWLNYQEADRRERRRGRSILDERIVDMLRAPPVPGKDARDAAHRAKPRLMRRMFGPLADLGSPNAKPLAARK